MIDFVKIELLPVTPDLIQTTGLEFYSLTNCQTGEVKERKEAKKEGLKFTINNSVVWLSGSLHNYFNKGLQNYNDFGFCDLLETLQKLEKVYHIPPETRLNSIEIGLNLLLNKNPLFYLNSFIFHKGQPFTMERDQFRTFRTCSHQRFSIKVYDKGKQFKLGRKVNLLRFEIHIKRMEHLKNMGINTLNDLKNPLKYRLLGDEILKIFEEITIGNPEHEPRNLSPRDNELFIKGHNPNYWGDILPVSTDYPQGNKNPEYRRKRKEYDRKMSRFEKLLNRTGANSLKHELGALIKNKIQYLLLKKRGKLTTIKKKETAENVTGERFCKITGIDITHQKKGSCFLSERTVKEIFNNDPATFKELERLFHGKNKTIGKRFYSIAHNIRNSESNPKRKERMKNLSSGIQLSLFTRYQIG